MKRLVGTTIILSLGLSLITARVRGQIIPDDTDFQLQWGLHNTGQVIGEQTGAAGADVDAPAAWAIHQGSPAVIVAIVGTGVDEHPEFADRTLPGIATTGDPYDTRDTNGAGTHAAGIIAAAINNGVGIAGLAPNARILPVRVLNDASGTESQAAQGIRWAVDQGAQIILVPLTFSVGSQVLADAVQYAVDNDAIVIAPTGNTGTTDTFFPAGFANCLAVTGTTNQDLLSPEANYDNGVDLAAPGHDIWSTWRDGGYAFSSGSTPASAFVAGVAALVRAYNPDLSGEQVRQILLDSTEDVGPAGPDTTFGAGRLNARQALEDTMPPPLRFEHIEPLPATIVQNATNSFSIRVASGIEQVVVDGVRLAHRLGADEFTFAPVSALGDDIFRVELPPVDCDTTLDYYLTAEGDGGAVLTDPPNAPASVHRTHAITRNTIFLDDFETDRGWTTTVIGEHTTGAWTRVVPVGTLAQPAYDRSPNAGTHCFVTGQHVVGKGVGSNDVDGGPVELISPIIPFHGHDVEISYARWFFWNEQGAEDTLTVDVSRDGGDTWFLVEEVSSASEWLTHRFRLSSAAPTGGGPLRLRFSTQDQPSDSLTEAGIDEVVVTELSCGASPGDADGDGDLDLVDLAAFAACVAGPNGLPDSEPCDIHDADRDGRVTLADYGSFQNRFTGAAP